MPTGDATAVPPETLTAAQVLDELAALAPVEHAMCADFLVLNYALGGSQAAMDMAIDEMRHLNRVNAVLAAARRPTVTARATDPTVDGFPARHKAVAESVDRRYARIQAALDSPTPPVFDDEAVAGTLNFLMFSASDHATPLAALTGQPTITRTEPRTDLERTLLELSDRYYQTIVTAVAVSFSNDGLLLGTATSTMGNLDSVNLRLAEEGLLPRFRLPAQR